MSPLSLDHPSPTTANRRSSGLFWAVAVLVLALLGGGGWYYFFGQKPKVVLSVPLKRTEDFTGARSWPISKGRVLVFAGRELKLCDLEERKVVWTAPVPAAAEMDPHLANVNARFAKLQAWADDLTKRRANLTTQKEIKDFNAEAAKYQAELAAARSEALKSPAAASPAAGKDPAGAKAKAASEAVSAAAEAAARSGSPVGAAKAVAMAAAAQTDAAQDIAIPHAAASQPTFLPPTMAQVQEAMDSATLAAARKGKGGLAPAAPMGPDFHAIVSPEVRILQDRLKRRAKELSDMERNIAAKARMAQTPLARAEVQELGEKHDALAAEQKADQEQVAKALSPTAPPTPTAKAAPSTAAPVAAQATGATAGPVPEEAGDRELPDGEISSLESAPVEAAVLGDRAWLVDGLHIVGFAMADGKVKADLRLAGPAMRVFADSTSLFVVADAGAQGRQLTHLDSNGVSQSLFMSAPPPQADSAMGGDHEAAGHVAAQQVAFTASGGSLARADIRMVERKFKTRPLIKPGTEQGLAKSIQNSAGNSTDEVLAISKMMEVDAMKLNGPATEQVDDSTYEVTITRPFAAGVPALKEPMNGHVQFISTPTLDLLTAGTKLVAMDRNNKRLWEAKLGAPIPERRDERAWAEAPEPLLEANGKLFLADGAFLTAFDMAQGTVVWRLPSVGIRKVEADEDGNLYVQSDNLSVNSLQYITTEDYHPENTVTMKVDPAEGKIRWQVPKYNDVWVSGKDVYACRETRNAADLENAVFDPKKVPEARVKFYKLSRRSGSPTWEWFQTRRPARVMPDGKTVAILFQDELQVIHSIAL